ncbi:MAG: autotransporter-associated beta strand repeat-containing protein [Verrucomicrobiae bacterium]|nr:autotransporter-associated beta strand repeat-containing protein [Verrucomicrobiae bacterium]
MKPKYHFIVRNRLPLLALAAPALALPLSAASVFWANSGTDFNAGASWIGGTAPGAADIASFAGAKTTDPSLSAPATIRGIAFTNAAASSYTISGSNLTLGRGGIDASAVASGTNTISAPLTLSAGGQTWSAGTGSTLAINPSAFSRATGAAVSIDLSGGTISTSTLANSLGILGPWATTGTGADTRYATVSGGALAGFAGATAVANFGWPSGNNNTFNYDVAGVGAVLGISRQANTARYTGPAATQNWGNNSTATLTINGLMNAGSGTLTYSETGGTSNGQLAVGTNNGNELALHAANADIQLNIPIINTGANAGSVLIRGPHAVNVTSSGGASTYTGSTTVASGTLLVSGVGNINTTSGITVNGADAKYLHTSSVASTRDVTLTNGTLDGTGTVGAVTVADNPASVITHGNGATTPLTAGSLTFNGDATVSINRGAAVPIVVTGALATTPANGQVILDVTNAVPNGLVDLIGFGSFAGSAADFTASFSGLGARQIAGVPQLNGNHISVNISGETIVWTGESDEAWSTAADGDSSGPNNWATKTAQTATNFWAADAVEFNDTYNLGSGDITVTQDYVNINSDVSPVATTFNNNSVDYTIDSFGDGIKSGTLTKNGTGTATLVGLHTFSGATTINAGTLKLGDDTYAGYISNTASVTNNGTLLYYWEFDGNAVYPISGGGNLVKENTGTLTLSGANTSTGATTISGGTVVINGAGGLGSGSLTVETGTLLDFQKTLTVGQTATGGGTIRNSTGTTTITGDFSGFGGTYQHASGTSSTVLNSVTATSANAAYEITAGTNTFQGILPNVAAGDNTFQLGSLSGVANTLVRNGGAVAGTTTLEIGALGTSTTFAGEITEGGGGGTLGITKVGAGTLTLTGPATYNGATQINQGTLELTTMAKALGASAVTLANGTSLRIQTPDAATTPLTSASLTLGSSTLAFDVNSLNPTVTQISTGALAVDGTVAVNILNANALTTGTYKLIDYTSISGAGSFPGGSFPVGNRGTAIIANNPVDSSIDLVVSSDTPLWTGLDNSNWVVGSTGASKNWKLATAGTAVDYLAGDIVRFDDSAAGTTAIVVNTDVNPLSTTFDNSSKNYSVSGSAGIATGSLTKSGTGATTVLTTNAYGGATTINGGTLQLGNGTTDGTIANTSGVTNNAVLAYNWAGDHDAPYPVSGTGMLTKAGAGTLNLTGNNTYSGGTSITGGVLTLTGAGSLGTGPIAVGAGTTLNINKSLALTNTVTGSGAIVNTFTLTNTGDFSGFSGSFTHNTNTQSVAFNTAAATSQNASYHIALDQGGSQGMIAGGAGDYTLQLGSLSGVANSLFRGGNAVTGTTTLQIGNLGTNTEFAGSINNGANKTLALTKIGSGTLTLSGANGYTGPTNINNGTLSVTGSITGTGLVTVNPGGTLGGSGSVAGTIIASGTIAPGASAGTLTTGPTTLTGTLAIEIDGATGDKLSSNGTLNLGGTTLTVALLGGGFTQPSYVIAEGTSITGSFASVPSGYQVNIVSGGPGQQAVLTTTGGGGYVSWAATNAGGETPDLDFNNDGVENGVAYFMNNAGRITLPGISGGAVTWTNGGNIPASAYGTQFVVQTSANLSSWTNVPVGNLTTNTNSTLTYTLPTGGGKVFVRLAVDPD